MTLKNNKFDYFNLSPFIILFWSLFSFFFIPIIPIASGFGWDGVFYGKVALDFQHMLGNIDSYHANRIFPGVLIHYSLVFLNSPLNLKSVLLGYRIYNIIILVGASVFWVQITKQLSFKPFKKWIGFIALFVNYPLLNLHFYYPALTDGTAFFIGMVMLYSYLKKNNVLLLAATVITFFCWPAGIVVGFVIFIYMNAPNVSWFYKQKNTSVFIIVLLLIPFLAFIGFNFVGEVKHLIVILGLDGKIIRKFNHPGNYVPINYTYLINAILNAIYLIVMFWLVLKKFDLIKFISFSLKKPIISKILFSILILIILILLKHLVYSPSLPTLTPVGYFSAYFFGNNVRFPLQFIVSQIAYWGPSIILFILFFRDFIGYLKKADLPWMLLFLVTVIFSINSESRPIINLYPFFIIILLQAVDFSKFRNKQTFTILFFVVSLLYSKVWLPIKLPSTVFPTAIWDNLTKFPMQWYFMNLGLWINFHMYLLHLITEAIFILLFWFFVRKQKKQTPVI